MMNTFVNFHNHRFYLMFVQSSPSVHDESSNKAIDRS